MQIVQSELTMTTQVNNGQCSKRSGRASFRHLLDMSKLREASQAKPHIPGGVLGEDGRSPLTRVHAHISARVYLDI